MVLMYSVTKWKFNPFSIYSEINFFTILDGHFFFLILPKVNYIYMRNSLKLLQEKLKNHCIEETSKDLKNMNESRT